MRYPRQIRKLPIYNGFLHKANGPAVIRAESLVRYPEAQTRTASPAIIRGRPIQKANGVGFATKISPMYNAVSKKVRLLNR